MTHLQEDRIHVSFVVKMEIARSYPVSIGDESEWRGRPLTLDSFIALADQPHPANSNEDYIMEYMNVDDNRHIHLFDLLEVDAPRYITDSEYRGDEYILESFSHVPGSANSWCAKEREKKDTVKKTRLDRSSSSVRTRWERAQSKLPNKRRTDAMKVSSISIEKVSLSIQDLKVPQRCYSKTLPTILIFLKNDSESWNLVCLLKIVPILLRSYR